MTRERRPPDRRVPGGTATGSPSTSSRSLPGSGRSWSVEERLGAAHQLHASWPRIEAAPDRRAVGACRVPSSSVVLGSTQPDEVVDAERAARRGIGVTRRRSGGGAVLVSPGEPVWIDVWVPAGDPLWSEDVTRAFDWVGEAWVTALGRLGLTGLSTHRSGLAECTRWSRQVCFGGIGRGEVVDGAGRKVVGLAQRRTRSGAWFHGACALHYSSAPLVDVLALSAAARLVAGAELDAAAVGAADLADTGADVESIDEHTVTQAFIDALPPLDG